MGSLLGWTLTSASQCTSDLQLLSRLPSAWWGSAWSRRPSTASRWPSAVAHPADGNLLDNCNTHVRWEVWANVHPSSERTHTLCPDMRVELAEFDSAAAAWQGVQGVMHLEQALSHALCS